MNNVVKTVAAKSLYNVIIMSFALFMTNSASRTFINGAQYYFYEIHEKNPRFHGNAYFSFFSIFGMVSLSFWVSPFIVTKIGLRVSMVIMCVSWTIYIAALYHPMNWLSYVTGLILGVGIAIGNTATGLYLAMNSTKETITRNSGIYWSIVSSGMIFGNVLNYLLFDGVDTKQGVVHKTFMYMLIMCSMGVILMWLTKGAVYNIKIDLGVLDVVIDAFRLFTERDMMLLCLTFVYVGMEGAFQNGFYSNVLGFTVKYEQGSVSTIALSGVALGVGTIVGGVTFGLTSLWFNTKSWTYYIVIILAWSIHVTCFVLIYLNLPNDVLKRRSASSTVIAVNQGVVLTISFFLAFGDACFSAEITAKIGLIFKDKSASAFAIYNFVRTSATCVTYLCGFVGLHPLLILLLIFSVVGTVSFCVVEGYLEQREDNTLESISSLHSSLNIANSEIHI